MGLAIWTDHPGGNLVFKTIKFDVMEKQPATKFIQTTRTDYKIRKIASPQSIHNVIFSEASQTEVFAMKHFEELWKIVVMLVLCFKVSTHITVVICISLYRLTTSCLPVSFRFYSTPPLLRRAARKRLLCNSQRFIFQQLKNQAGCLM